MIQHIRFAVRMLMKTPAFTCVAILALGLGIGASTTNFTSVNTILLRPLPYIQDQDRIVFLTQFLSREAEDDMGLAWLDMLELRKQAKTLEGVAGLQEATFIVTTGDKPQRYLGAQVTPNLFGLLGVQPILGRNFRAEEGEPTAAPVVLIGYDVWQNHFGGVASVIGKTLPVNGKESTIIGVMPRGWRFPETSDIWLPLVPAEKDMKRGSFFMFGLGKIRDGFTLKEAQAEVSAIGAALAQEFPATNAGISVRLKMLRDEFAEEARTLILLLMGFVVFVHLIACANVANLLLSRGATRAREMAIRVALGAGRRQIVTQLLIESVLLGLAGSAAGLLFAVWGVDLMVAAIPVEIPFFIDFSFDWRVFAFAVGTGVLSALVFGLFPAWQSSKPNLVDVLKEGGRSGAGGAKSHRVRNALVVAEVALALILLVGAGLMLRSFLKLQAAEIGIDESSTLTFRVGLPPVQYTDERMAADFFDKLIPRLATLPGVESAGATVSLPATGQVGIGGFQVFGEPEPAQLQNARLAHPIVITPGYLRTCRIPLLQGRDFTSADTEEAPLVVLVDEDTARQWFPGKDVIGQKLRTVEKLGEPPKWATVVGLVRNVQVERLTNNRKYPVVYFPQSQQPSAFLSVVMRTKSDPLGFVQSAQSGVLSVNNQIPIYRVLTMEQVIAQSYWERGFFGSIFATFAGLALFLASLGLYAVMAYSVRQRTQEIGLRVALGAQARDVFRLITMRGLRLILFGLLIGFVGAFFLMRLLAGSLHEISAHDPLSFAVVPLLLLLVGLMACYLPARAAMRMDPVEALRYE